ncbi:hypothetical protein CBI45_10095, partial [Corynebacterium kefirresidentii]
MDISRSLPRKRWTLLTAILATIAVIAALLTVPLNKASAAEPTDFMPNTTLGNEDLKTIKGPQGDPTDYEWGELVWAGAPSLSTKYTKATDVNDVGWAWCLEPTVTVPLKTAKSFEKAKATKLVIDNPEHRDAMINLARKLESAAARGDKKSVNNYYVYLLAFLDTQTATKIATIGTIRNDEEDKYIVSNDTGRRVKFFPAFTGSEEEFTKLTGFKIQGEVDGGMWNPLKFVKDDTVKIPEQPADAYITVVHPGGVPNNRIQSVMPVDQPGLPDENGGSGSNPSTKTPKISTKVDQLDEHEALK